MQILFRNIQTIIKLLKWYSALLNLFMEIFCDMWPALSVTVAFII